MSNLQVADLGFSIRPLGSSKSKMLRDLQVMGKFLKYWKTNPSGGINEGAALDFGYDVGWGFDLMLGWKLTAELSVLAAYGNFNPGRAFEENIDNYHIFLFGFNLSL